MWDRIKGAITRISAVFAFIVLRDTKIFKEWTWNDTKEICRFIGELSFIIGGFGIPPVFVKWYFLIPIYIAMSILTMVIVYIEHKRYLQRHH